MFSFLPQRLDFTLNQYDDSREQTVSADKADFLLYKKKDIRYKKLSQYSYFDSKCETSVYLSLRIQGCK